MAIVLETGTGESNSNSYVDHQGAFFTDYLAGHAYGSDLAAAATELKEKLVRMATRVLDANISWQGYRKEDDQALEWPRMGVVVDDRVVSETIVPVPVQQATMELAINLLRRDTTDPNYEAPVNKINLGDGALQLDLGESSEAAPASETIPDAVAILVRKYGRRIGGTTRQRRVARA